MASFLWKQPLPPCRGAVATVRERVLKPVRQVLVHEDQRLQADIAQSTGQAAVLQERVSDACGHKLPPYFGCVNERERL